MEMYKSFFLFVIALGAVFGVCGFTSDVYKDFSEMPKENQIQTINELKIYREEILEVLILDYVENGHSLQEATYLAEKELNNMISILENILEQQRECEKYTKAKRPGVTFVK